MDTSIPGYHSRSLRTSLCSFICHAAGNLASKPLLIINKWAKNANDNLERADAYLPDLVAIGK